MKHPQKPTREQRKLIANCGLDTYEWYVVKDTPEEMLLVHRHSDKTTTLSKEN